MFPRYHDRFQGSIDYPNQYVSLHWITMEQNGVYSLSGIFCMWEFSQLRGLYLVRHSSVMHREIFTPRRFLGYSSWLFSLCSRCAQRPRAQSSFAIRSEGQTESGTTRMRVVPGINYIRRLLWEHPRVARESGPFLSSRVLHLKKKKWRKGRVQFTKRDSTFRSLRALLRFDVQLHLLEN